MDQNVNAENQLNINVRLNHEEPDNITERTRDKVTQMTSLRNTPFRTKNISIEVEDDLKGVQPLHKVLV